MTRRASARAGLAALAVVAVVAVGWAVTSGTTYLAIRGASMRPAVAAGDLAVVRHGGPYRVGEIAAYRSATLHRVVLHRIAAVDGSTYTFKGDANSFNDPEQVGRGALVGRLAVRIPYLGAALLWLSHPFNAVLLVGFVSLALWDRRRLVGLARPAGTEQPTPESWRAHVDPSRLVTITDLSFPQELAVAEVPDLAELARLATRYDRPMLHEASTGVLFVVETGILYRCDIAGSGTSEPATLSIVRPMHVAEDPPLAVEPAASPLNSEPWRLLDPEMMGEVTTAAAGTAGTTPETDGSQPSTRRSGPHRWYAGPPADRRHTPQGRDWGYAAAVHAPVHRPGA